ncbi:helix-turn-helix domain-containing protein [Sporosarcina sp. FSL K6-1522]|uniref:helix-turn-helix domain-containing protein n=1 Tax=Sporosarcina sp. FSL K6-1522 TaxID=2921554 RepID=UPI003159FC1B
MGIGSRIKAKRKENRFTQIELAKLVNVSPQVISNWERGYSNLSSDDVARLADALNCTTEYLHGKTLSEKDEQAKLTPKDERDMAKRMDKMKRDLIEGRANGQALLHKGEPMSEEAMESLLEALEMAERITTLANKKFAPNKYKDEE